MKNLIKFAFTNYFMVFKEDINEAKERMKAWWDHEIVDRPVFSYFYPTIRGKMGAFLDVMGEDWTLAQNPDGIEEALDGFEQRAEITYFGGESIPSYFPNYGPGIVAAFFGVTPVFKSGTVWFSHPTKPNEIIDLLESVKLNQNNEWYSRLLKVTEYAAKRAGKQYLISHSDLGGVLDILSSFLGATNIILTMKRDPNIIDSCSSIILEKLLKVYDDMQDVIEKHCDGCNGWLNVWSSKRWAPLQCDFSAMLNPKWFKRFVLPNLIAETEHFEHSIYHMDGPNQIPYLDDFLSIPTLTGIQWVPGAGKPPMGSPEWMPLYKKIQAAGKNLVIDASPEIVSSVYKNLNSKGLYVRTFYRTEIIKNFYLPSFLGGEDGVLIDDARIWLEKQGKNKIMKEELDTFLRMRKIEVNNRVRKDLLKEINSSMLDKNNF